MSDIQITTKFDLGHRIYFIQRENGVALPICGEVVGLLPVIGEAGREESYCLSVPASSRSWTVPVSQLFSSACDIVLACQQENFSKKKPETNIVTATADSR